MKHTKTLLALLLAVVMVCVGLPLVAAEEPTIVDSGYCGEWDNETESFLESIHWSLNSEGTIVFEGTGVLKDKYLDCNENGSILHQNPAFSPYKESIKSAVIYSGIEEIEGAFRYCYNLKNVVIPNTVKRIGDDAFINCKNLETLVLPDSVEEIGNYAFNGCNKLHLTIGKNVKEIGVDALDFVRSFSISDENPWFVEQEGVLYNKEKTEIYDSCIGASNVSIPETVYKIRDWVFAGNALESLTLPEGLTEIGTMAFAYSYLLERVTIPKSVQTIGDYAFITSIFLKDITVRGMYTQIGTWALGFTEERFTGIPENIAKEMLLVRLGLAEETETTKYYWEHIEEYAVVMDEEPLKYGTIHCHAGSTAEAYAIEHNMDYELTHFYEGDWNYDWDNLVRWRKCIHCDERETEPLETETPGGAEIVGPADGDTSFDVEPVSTDYVLIQEVLGEQNVVKAFDISLKNQDGVHVQPKGTVKVKLPGDFQTGDYKVYRVNADGTYTDMNAFRQGSHLVFYTDHFSLYVVVDESAQTEPDTPDTPDTPAKENKVYNILHTVFEFLQKLIRLLFAK